MEALHRARSEVEVEAARLRDQVHRYHQVLATCQALAADSERRSIHSAQRARAALTSGVAVPALPGTVPVLVASSPASPRLLQSRGSEPGSQIRDVSRERTIISQPAPVTSLRPPPAMDYAAPLRLLSAVPTTSAVRATSPAPWTVIPVQEPMVLPGDLSSPLSRPPLVVGTRSSVPTAVPLEHSVPPVQAHAPLAASARYAAPTGSFVAAPPTGPFGAAPPAPAAPFTFNHAPVTRIVSRSVSPTRMQSFSSAVSLSGSLRSPRSGASHGPPLAVPAVLVPLHPIHGAPGAFFQSAVPGHPGWAASVSARAVPGPASVKAKSDITERLQLQGAKQIASILRAAAARQTATSLGLWWRRVVEESLGHSSTATVLTRLAEHDRLWNHRDRVKDLLSTAAAAEGSRAAQHDRTLSILLGLRQLHALQLQRDRQTLRHAIDCLKSVGEDGQGFAEPPPEPAAAVSRKSTRGSMRSPVQSGQLALPPALAPAARKSVRSSVRGSLKGADQAVVVAGQRRPSPPSLRSSLVGPSQEESIASRSNILQELQPFDIDARAMAFALAEVTRQRQRYIDEMRQKAEASEILQQEEPFAGGEAPWEEDYSLAPVPAPASSSTQPRGSCRAALRNSSDLLHAVPREAKPRSRQTREPPADRHELALWSKPEAEAPANAAAKPRASASALGRPVRPSLPTPAGAPAALGPRSSGAGSSLEPHLQVRNPTHFAQVQADPHGEEEEEEEESEEEEEEADEVEASQELELIGPVPGLSSKVTTAEVSKRRTIAAQALGVPKTAGRKTVVAAFRKGAKELHPDKGGCTEDFQVLNEAYILLNKACAAQSAARASIEGSS